MGEQAACGLGGAGLEREGAGLRNHRMMSV